MAKYGFLVILLSTLLLAALLIRVLGIRSSEGRAMPTKVPVTQQQQR